MLSFLPVILLYWALEASNYGGMVMTTQIVYTTKQIADLLALTSSSIRKYAVMIEDNGHKFAKSDAGHRIYAELDFKALQRMKLLIDRGSSVTDAAKQAVKDVEITELMTIEDKPLDKKDEQLNGITEMLKALRNEVNGLRQEISELKEDNKQQALLLEQSGKSEQIKLVENVDIEKQMVEIKALNMELLDKLNERMEDKEKITEVEESSKSSKSFISRLFNRS